jgi:hypothetical protein
MNISEYVMVEKKYMALFAVVLLAIMPFLKLAAQPIPAGSIQEQQFRTLQLLSDSTITTSFLNRPIWYSSYKKVFNPSNTNNLTWWGHPLSHWETSVSLSGYGMQIGAYNPVFTNTFNSKLPYGQNNGAAWYGRGLSTELKIGFYLTSKYFTITLRPDFLYTQNRYFTPPQWVPHYANGDIRWVDPGSLPEYRLGNLIDLPFRFGPGPYSTLDMGLSSIRIHYKQIEAGFSKGSLWWGPGVRYALAMSNNAAGLRHLFIGTKSPISLPLNIGKIGFRWIFGWPKDSPYFDLYDLNHYVRVLKQFGIDLGEYRNYYLDRPRILNGINFIYTPSFLPNLSIGIARVIQQYVPDGGLSFTKDILDVFEPFPKASGKDITNSSYQTPGFFIKKYPVSSLYFRWVFPRGDAEIYGEYYKDAHNVNFRDFLMEPQNGRAYTLGMQKLIEFNGPINFLKINAEINSTEEGWIDEVRPQKYIYTDAAVRQGYTNRGQIMGAAIGPGGKSQFLGVTGFFKKGKAGIFVQREVLKQHFYYELLDRYISAKARGNVGIDSIHHREDLNVGLDAAYKIGTVLLKGSFIWNRNYNYNLGFLSSPHGLTTPIPILDNLHFQISINYIF